METTWDKNQITTEVAGDSHGAWDLYHASNDTARFIIDAYVYLLIAIKECKTAPQRRTLLEWLTYSFPDRSCLILISKMLLRLQPCASHKSTCFDAHHDMYRSYLPSRGGVSSIVIVPSVPMRLKYASLSASIPFVLGSMTFSLETPRAVRRL